MGQSFLLMTETMIHGIKVVQDIMEVGDGGLGHALLYV